MAGTTLKSSKGARSCLRHVGVLDNCVREVVAGIANIKLASLDVD